MGKCQPVVDNCRELCIVSDKLPQSQYMLKLFVTVLKLDSRCDPAYLFAFPPNKEKVCLVYFLGFSKSGFKFGTFIVRPEFNLDIFHLLDRSRVLRLLVNPKTRQV